MPANSMACPVCQSLVSSVIDKRSYASRTVRRRVCDKGHRYSTKEITTTKK